MSVFSKAVSQELEEAEDLPSEIAQLLTNKGQLNLFSSITFINTSDSIADRPITLVPSDANSFFIVPTNTEETDIINGAINVNYGLTDKLEVNFNGSYSFVDTRSTNDFLDQSEFDFNSLFAGASYQFRDSKKGPAIIGFANILLNDNTGESSSFGDSFSLGLTSFTQIDPIVLSISIGYQVNDETRSLDGSFIDPGDVIFLTANSSFVVNHQVSISGGIGWTSINSSVINNIESIRRTDTTLNLSISHRTSNKDFFLYSFSTGGVTGGNSIGLSWSHDFN